MTTEGFVRRGERGCSPLSSVIKSARCIARIREKCPASDESRTFCLSWAVNSAERPPQVSEEMNGGSEATAGLGDEISRTTLVHLGGGFLHGGTVGTGVSFRHSCDGVAAAVCGGGKIVLEIAIKVNFFRLVCALLGFLLLGFANSGSSDRRDRCKLGEKSKATK